MSASLIGALGLTILSIFSITCFSLGNRLPRITGNVLVSYSVLGMFFFVPSMLFIWNFFLLPRAAIFHVPLVGLGMAYLFFRELNQGRYGMINSLIVPFVLAGSVVEAITLPFLLVFRTYHYVFS